MKQLTAWYRALNLLSLDVAGGAVISALFFARIFAIHILPWGWMSLGLTVWIIYTADHLIDAHRTQVPAASTRHRFHQKYFRTILTIWSAAVICDVVLIMLIRKAVLHWGLGLSVTVIIYFLVQPYLKYIKEIVGAFLYCAGVLLPVIALSGGSVDPVARITIAPFALTVLCNLILFSFMDLGRDKQDHHHSLATELGERKTRIVLSILFSLNSVLLLIGAVSHLYSGATLTVLASMNGLLLLIFLFRKRLGADEKFRLLGDAIFFIPLLSLM